MEIGFKLFPGARPSKPEQPADELPTPPRREGPLEKQEIAGKPVHDPRFEELMHRPEAAPKKRTWKERLRDLANLRFELPPASEEELEKIRRDAARAQRGLDGDFREAARMLREQQTRITGGFLSRLASWKEARQAVRQSAYLDERIETIRSAILRQAEAARQDSAIAGHYATEEQMIETFQRFSPTDAEKYREFGLRSLHEVPRDIDAAMTAIVKLQEQIRLLEERKSQLLAKQ